MAKQIINIGTAADDKTGDPLRTAFSKINGNFDEMYTVTGNATFTELASNVTITSGNLNLDCNVGTYFYTSLNSNIGNINISNPPGTGSAIMLTVEFTANGTQYNVNWPSSFKWSGNIAPTMTSTNSKIDLLTISTRTGGNVWLAAIAQSF